MEQTYNPNLLTPAVAGWCLKYIDDAGGLPATNPPRTGTAKIAFNNEMAAGRIKTSLLPENVWLVGFLDFTKGAYKAYGHIFFIKRNVNSYQIYDSEVQSGARRPYGSIEELLAWFGAYNPKYTGWSTNCDGRQYAKEKQMSSSQTIADQLTIHLEFNSSLLRQPSPEELKHYVGAKITVEQLQRTLIDSAEHKNIVKIYNGGKKPEYEEVTVYRKVK